MQSLLLLDTDIIIALHRLGFWERLKKTCNIYTASTVIDETTHYPDNDGMRVEIDLRKQVVEGSITELSGSMEVLADVLVELKKGNLEKSIDPGETESITIIYENQLADLLLCIRERAAIIAVSYLGLKEKAISIEQVLVDNKIISKSNILHSVNTKARFDAISIEGAFLRVATDS